VKASNINSDRKFYQLSKKEIGGWKNEQKYHRYEININLRIQGIN
jgi:hypothetical protein